MHSHVGLTEDSVSGHNTADKAELALLQVQTTCPGKVFALWFQKCCSRRCLCGYHRRFYPGRDGSGMQAESKPPGLPR